MINALSVFSHREEDGAEDPEPTPTALVPPVEAEELGALMVGRELPRAQTTASAIESADNGMTEPEQEHLKRTTQVARLQEAIQRTNCCWSTVLEAAY